MKIFGTKQIRAWDQATIDKGISSIDLMERAASLLTKELIARTDLTTKIACVAGIGNNGGDALAIARLLKANGYAYIKAFLIATPAMNLSPDCEFNAQRVPELKRVSSESDLPTVHDWQQFDLIIDGLFGTGLSRPLEGIFTACVQGLNSSGVTIISIDIPSGSYPEEIHPDDLCIHADDVLTLQAPKRSFLLPESSAYMGGFNVLNLGLDPAFHNAEPCDHFYLEEHDVQRAARSKFSHKGSYGHGLLLAGSRGMYGAAQLSAKACLRSGVGLLTVHSGAEALPILQTTVPEAMFSADKMTDGLSQLPDMTAASAVACGPGIGQSPATHAFIDKLLQVNKLPLILDADALNIIASEGWQERIPSGTIVTPHPKEFMRLFGTSKDQKAAVELQRSMARDLELVIVRKGAHSTIAMPDGRIYFNSTGNPYMATGGMGDVLTGFILGLRAQGLSAEQAALTGVFYHGLAGDRALAHRKGYGLISSDVISYL